MSVSKENSSASEVLDALAQRVHVQPENLRLTEVGPSSRAPNMWTRVLPASGLGTCTLHVWGQAVALVEAAGEKALRLHRRGTRSPAVGGLPVAGGSAAPRFVDRELGCRWYPEPGWCPRGAVASGLAGPVLSGNVASTVATLQPGPQ